ncbi:dTDP-4-dehydrorhamnose reductase [Clostridium beijerinckii]|uniref:dTDP-4-dehydrorhamnose reductase n=1 Tax=Clostridium beijerinckii TaxID=1520 RepID=A0A7X9SP60_CLOBE|nr:dTDP-4-dehydrorhamnose reductase [Clostridium beijerinckii]NMF05454.1 dTDP-4-dehydrorhamnose reductase [Clostridium beijerinckii]
MKILITGAKGQLGREITEIIKVGRADIDEISESIKIAEVIGFDVDELDITNLVKVKEVLSYLKPEVVINCAAATNVDRCEIDEDFAFRVNSIGPRNLAIACDSIGAKLVQVSTDYVFNENTHKPLKEYDLASPSSVYGKTKFLGEQYVQLLCSKHFIVRTAWLYGYVGSNFVYTIMKLSKEKSHINVVNDQMGNPTYANDLAYHILKLIETDGYGIYHCTNNGECTWYEFAKRIVKLSGEECEVIPCTSEEYKTQAKRPKYSSLDNAMLRNTVGDEMRDWKDAIEAFISKLGK